MHWDHAPFYIRRMRVSEHHPPVEICRRGGYEVEPDHYSKQTAVISSPVAVDRRKADVPLREKVDLAAQMQRFWSDNQVSCTGDFDPEREADVLTHCWKRTKTD